MKEKFRGRAMRAEKSRQDQPAKKGPFKMLGNEVKGMRGVLRTPGRENNTCKGPGVELTPQQRGQGEVAEDETLQGIGGQDAQGLWTVLRILVFKNLGIH